MNEAGGPPGQRTGPTTTGLASANGRATDRVPIRAVVIEDSPAQRTHLVRILQAEGDIEVVGLATTAGEAVDLVAGIRPDVVALGLQPRDPRGKNTIEQIMARAPTAGPSERRTPPSCRASPPARPPRSRTASSTTS